MDTSKVSVCLECSEEYQETLIKHASGRPKRAIKVQCTLMIIILCAALLPALIIKAAS